MRAIAAKLTYIWIAGALTALLFFAPSAAGAQGAPGPVTLTLTCGGRTVTVTDKPVEPTNHIVADEIEARRCNAPFEEKMRLVDLALNAGAGYAYAVDRCFPRVTKALEQLKAQCERPAEDSRIRFDPDRRPMFTITRDKQGAAVDTERAYKEIYVALKRCAVKNVDRAAAAIPLDPVSPGVSVRDNVRLTTLRSRFSTPLAGSTAARKSNVRLALSKINGTVLMPGEEFSFNNVVGPRTAENGFLEAKIIVDGEYVKGYGGGVCQASTTLYNCALTSDMRITAVRNHTLEPGYVAPSLDAMVNAGSSDLCFVNAGDGPVFIRAYADEKEACAEIYGSRLPYRIAAESVVIKRGEAPADCELVDLERKYVGVSAAAGERVRVSYGKGSVESEGYLSYYTADNRLIRRVKIRTDVYAAHAGIIAVAP